MENHDTDFNVLVLLALETGARRGELLELKKEDIYEFGIKIVRSLSPTSNDTRLKTNQSKREISINKEVYDLLITIKAKNNGYIF